MNLTLEQLISQLERKEYTIIGLVLTAPDNTIAMSWLAHIASNPKLLRTCELTLANALKSGASSKEDIGTPIQ